MALGTPSTRSRSSPSAQPARPSRASADDRGQRRMPGCHARPGSGGQTPMAQAPTAGPRPQPPSSPPHSPTAAARGSTAAPLPRQPRSSARSHRESPRSQIRAARRTYRRRSGQGHAGDPLRTKVYDPGTGTVRDRAPAAAPASRRLRSGRPRTPLTSKASSTGSRRAWSTPTPSTSAPWSLRRRFDGFDRADDRRRAGSAPPDRAARGPVQVGQAAFVQDLDAIARVRSAPLFSRRSSARRTTSGSVVRPARP